MLNWPPPTRLSNQCPLDARWFRFVGHLALAPDTTPETTIIVKNNPSVPLILKKTEYTPKCELLNRFERVF